MWKRFHIRRFYISAHSNISPPEEEAGDREKQLEKADKIIPEDQLIPRLIDLIGKSDREVIYVGGEGRFIQQYPQLVETLSQAAIRGVKVTFYFTSLSKDIIIKLISKGCNVYLGEYYPGTHFVTTENECYSHKHLTCNHPRQDDNFIEDSAQVKKAKIRLKELIKDKKTTKMYIGIPFGAKVIAILILMASGLPFLAASSYELAHDSQLGVGTLAGSILTGFISIFTVREVLQYLHYGLLPKKHDL